MKVSLNLLGAHTLFDDSFAPILDIAKLADRKGTDTVSNSDHVATENLFLVKYLRNHVTDVDCIPNRIPPGIIAAAGKDSAYVVRGNQQ